MRRSTKHAALLRQQRLNSLAIESLEARHLLASASTPELWPIDASAAFSGAAALVVLPPNPAPRAPLVPNASVPLGQTVAAYLTSKLGTRLGGGECAHLATEALRASGSQFVFTQPVGPAGYVWSGSPPVAQLTKGSQVIGKRFQVGDVLQFENALFKSGRLIRHHTQVVASVDASGRIISVFEQNTGGRRTVQRNAGVDLAKLTGGMVTIYRPSPRVDRPGRFEFTVVNNTASPQTYHRRSGSWSAAASLDRANTVGSYKHYWSTFSPGVVASLVIGGSSVPIRNAAAYELYTTASGKVAIRQLR